MTHDKTIDAIWKTSTYFYTLFLLVTVCKQDYAKCKETKRYFSFIYTERTSPLNIKDTCYAIDNSSLHSMYLGISFFIKYAGRNTSCELRNIELTEMRKYIIRDRQQRKLCRTKITVSINSRKCEKTIAGLFVFCQSTQENSSIFFQECMAVSYPSNDESNAVETSEIILANFPKPPAEYGHVYGIPQAHCNIKEDRLENGETIGHRENGTYLYLYFHFKIIMLSLFYFCKQFLFLHVFDIKVL